MPVPGVQGGEGMMPIPDAAQELGVSVATLRRWIQRGCPVASRGRRGRGCRTLVDPVAVRAWRRQSDGSDFARTLAGYIPELVGEAVNRSFLATDGPHKRAVAGVLGGCWYLVTTAILDRLREHSPDIPEVSTLPEPVANLRKIATQ